jgi:uracil-DNA glycosylase
VTLPLAECRACPRLAAFRDGNGARFPGWHNAPVAATGDPLAKLLVVGLAPGLKGANRTGVPFCGDDSGDWLWDALHREGFANEKSARDRPVALRGAAVTNAVKCVPPANKPNAGEIGRCRVHLEAELAAFSQVRVIVALGRIAHEAVLRVFGLSPRERAFKHGRVHRLPEGMPLLVDSFHPSPLNTRTGRLSKAAWRRVWAKSARLVTEQWFVYVARCGDGSLYTGITTDPQRRQAEHSAGKGAAYTRRRGPVVIVHVEEAASKGAALSREYAIKQLARREKLALIATGCGLSVAR